MSGSQQTVGSRSQGAHIQHYPPQATSHAPTYVSGTGLVSLFTLRNFPQDKLIWILKSQSVL